MDLKDYHKTIEQKLSFEEWKATMAPSMPEDKISALSRLHEIDYKEQWQLTLEREYAEYLSNLNGNWLL
jgi:hypothetical protein